MPFYSRHSSDGRDRFLGGIHDEEDYDQFMKMIFISSKTKKYQREYHRKYYKEKMQKPYTCKFCGKTLSDSSNIRRHEKSRRCTEAKTTV